MGETRGARGEQRVRAVIAALRAAGANGLTTEDVANAVGAPAPSIYVLLHKLEMRDAVAVIDGTRPQRWIVRG